MCSHRELAKPRPRWQTKIIYSLVKGGRIVAMLSSAVLFTAALFVLLNSIVSLDSTSLVNLIFYFPFTLFNIMAIGYMLVTSILLFKATKAPSERKIDPLSSSYVVDGMMYSLLFLALVVPHNLGLTLAVYRFLMY